MLNRAEGWGVLPRGQNPARWVKPFREYRRQRFLNEDELRRLSDTLRRFERSGDVSLYAVAAFRLLIATGARCNEIRTLEWRQVDLSRRIILLEEHKTSAYGAKVLPLNSAAVRVLEGLPRVHGNPYVICGDKPGAAFVNLQKAWRKVRCDCDLEDVRIHDLRHTFASLSLAKGASLPVVGALLGHKSVASTAVYAHLAQAPLQQATASVAEELEHLL